jgi:hypothetical protein
VPIFKIASLLALTVFLATQPQKTPAKNAGVAFFAGLMNLSRRV